jgi:hypothetical protein
MQTHKYTVRAGGRIFESLNLTSLLVPGDPGRLGTPIYIFTKETPRPGEASHTSCMQSLWKPCDPSKEGAPIYLVTSETSRPVGAKHSSCKQLLCKPRDAGRQAHPFTYLPLNPRDPWRQGTFHVRSYCGKAAIRAGKTRPFT